MGTTPWPPPRPAGKSSSPPSPPQEQETHPARYALVELVNLHDDSLEFEPIHRVVFGVDPQKLLADLLAAYPGAHTARARAISSPYVLPGERGTITVPNPTAQLAVGTLQNFLDRYLEENGGKVDYIHGEDVVEQLASQPGSIGFLLPAMGKDQLFPTVIFDGALPRRPSPWARPTTSASTWRPGGSSEPTHPLRPRQDQPHPGHPRGPARRVPRDGDGDAVGLPLR